MSGKEGIDRLAVPLRDAGRVVPQVRREVAELLIAERSRKTGQNRLMLLQAASVVGEHEHEKALAQGQVGWRSQSDLRLQPAQTLG
jgi:hypothetical protein